MAAFPKLVKLALSLVLVLVAQLACNQGAASGDVQVVNTRMLTEKKLEGITLHSLMKYVLTHLQLWQVSIAVQGLGVCTGCLSYVLWKRGEAKEDKKPDVLGIFACSSQVSDMLSDVGVALMLLQLWWELAVASFVHLVAVACFNFFIVKRFVSNVQGSSPTFWAIPAKNGKAFPFLAIMVFALFGPQILKVFGTHAMGMALCDLDLEDYFEDTVNFTRGVIFEASFQIVINILAFTKLYHTMTQAQRVTNMMSAAYSIFNMLVALMECAFATRQVGTGSGFHPLRQGDSDRTADIEMEQSHLEELEAATTPDKLGKAIRRARNSGAVSDEALQTFESKLKKLVKMQALEDVEAVFPDGDLEKKREKLKSAQQLGVLGLEEFERSLKAEEEGKAAEVARKAQEAMAAKAEEERLAAQATRKMEEARLAAEEKARLAAEEARLAAEEKARLAAQHPLTGLWKPTRISEWHSNAFGKHSERAQDQSSSFKIEHDGSARYRTGEWDGEATIQVGPGPRWEGRYRSGYQSQDDPVGNTKFYFDLLPDGAVKLSNTCTKEFWNRKSS